MNSNKTAPKVEPARHWINGEWISSSNVAESVSPSTGEAFRRRGNMVYTMMKYMKA
jgi:hypothetical protein